VQIACHRGQVGCIWSSECCHGAPY
jgi:hypothetical protein